MLGGGMAVAARAFVSALPGYETLRARIGVGMPIIDVASVLLYVLTIILKLASW